jgi:hypothetical protein
MPGAVKTAAFVNKAHLSRSVVADKLEIIVSFALVWKRFGDKEYNRIRFPPLIMRVSPVVCTVCY